MIETTERPVDEMAAAPMAEPMEEFEGEGEAGVMQRRRLDDLEPAGFETFDEWRAAVYKQGYGSQDAEAVEQMIAAHVWESASKMAQIRQTSPFQIDERHELEERKFRFVETPAIDPVTKQVIKTDINAHKKAGLDLGLYADAVNTITPRLFSGMTGSQELPVVFTPDGERKENVKKRELITAIAKRHEREARWKAEIASGALDLSKHGTAIWRQSWVEEVEMVQSQDGVWTEEVTRRGMSFEHWPLLSVYVSNPERRHAWDQDAVVFESQVTLTDLQAHEMVIDAGETIEIDGGTGEIRMVTMPQYRGKYFNLEGLRVAEFEHGDTKSAEVVQSDSGNTHSQARSKQAVSVMKVYTRREYQGWFPQIAAMINSGAITAEDLARWGVEIRQLDATTKKPVPVTNPKILARLASRLMWYVTTVCPAGSGAQGAVIIECRPCPYRVARNELIHGVLVSEGTFYGGSLDTISADVGEAANKLVNDIVSILDNNADAPTLINLTNMDDEHKAVMLAKKPGSVVQFNLPDGMKIADCIMERIRAFDPNLVTALQMLIDFYNSRTFVSQVMKGSEAQTQSGTLGEAQLQASSNEERIGFIAQMLAAHYVTVTSWRLWLMDLDWFLDSKELDMEAKRAAGLSAIGEDTVFLTEKQIEGNDTPTPLYKEISVQFASDPSIRPEVVVQLINDTLKNFKEVPEVSVPDGLLEAYRLIGYDPRNWIKPHKTPLNPIQEAESLLDIGDDLQVPDDEPPGIHLPYHQMQLDMITQIRELALIEGGDVEPYDRMVEALTKHIKETIDHDMAVAQMQMMMAMAMGAAPGAAGPNAGGQGGVAGKPPPDQDKMGNGMAANAGAGPAPVGGANGVV